MQKFVVVTKNPGGERTTFDIDADAYHFDNVMMVFSVERKLVGAFPIAQLVGVYDWEYEGVPVVSSETAETPASV